MTVIKRCGRCNGRGTIGGATRSALVPTWTCPACDGDQEIVAASAYRELVEIVRALVAANDTRDGAIGEIQTTLGSERADQLRAILAGH